MSPILRREPNFKVEILNRKKTSVELYAADSKDELAQRLQKRVDEQLILSYRIEPYDFAAWKAKARRETARVIWAKRRKEPYDFNAYGQIWRAMKDYLRVAFNGKCAYCDAKFDTVAWGDVEHYRPKGKVTNDEGNDIDHPGYYWLAYDLHNLLPSCQLCNQATGKGNRFPLRDESRRRNTPSRPNRMDAEEPLLLNPYLHDAGQHLKFIPGRAGISFGTVVGIDDVGQATEEIYDLNREPLIEARRKQQRAGLNSFKEALLQERPEVMTQLIRDCEGGRLEFSSAILAEVKAYCAAMGINLTD